jgi:DNA-nicking Smr family endonuclease
MEPVRIPIEDVLDLHQFSPKDIPCLLKDYFFACQDLGLLTVRIIHGKGHGILKKGVLEFLKKSPTVISYRSAPSQAGGWGATIVMLKPKCPK